MKQSLDFTLIKKRLEATFPCNHINSQLINVNSTWIKCKDCGEVLGRKVLERDRRDAIEHQLALDLLLNLEAALETKTKEIETLQEKIALLESECPANNQQNLSCAMLRKSLEHIHEFIGDILTPNL